MMNAYETSEQFQNCQRSFPAQCGNTLEISGDLKALTALKFIRCNLISSFELLLRGILSGNLHHLTLMYVF